LHKDAKGRLLKFRKDKAQDKIKPKVFIVHGRDENTLHEVKDYLQNSLKLGKPLILNEKPFLGRTIIEKFEKYARQANLIFVILTPDDKMAKESDDKESKLHARQNVILELGYFYGKIGRLEGRVILLYKGKRKGKIDIPTDLSGVGYIDISDGIAGKESDTRIREEIHQFLS
jgi:predicted nucleotide-binding protein